MTVAPPPKRLVSPIKAQRISVALACGIVANTWHDLDTTGSASARNLDVVIPNVQAGQWVAIDPQISSNSAATAVYLDMHTIVAGAPVHRFGGDHDPASVGAEGGWVLISGIAGSISGRLWYQVQPEDIENGSVRCRLRDCNTTTTARSVNAVAAIPLSLVGSGPF